MKRLLVRATGRGYLETEIEDMCLVINSEIARWLLMLREACKPVLGLSGLYAVSFFNHNFDLVTPPEWWTDNDDVRPVHPDVVLVSPEFRIDTPMVYLKPDAVLWHFYERHTNILVESCNVYWEDVEELAKESA